MPVSTLPNQPSRLFAGLMSGTSLDGVDAVLAEFRSLDAPPHRVLAHHHLPMPPPLHAELAALNRSGADELHRAALAGNALAEWYAQALADAVAAAGVSREQVVAAGAHGQTVRHRPGAFDGSGYTCQLLNGSLLAEISGIDVVCDFRSADVAAGGQGAPLVPAFHAACFAAPDHDRAVLNLGGMANLTLLPTSGVVRGFDTGPGNVLLDLWASRCSGQPFDAEGAIAARGQVMPQLLAALLADPYFALPPPKSTGRDDFNAEWFDRHWPSDHVSNVSNDPQAADVMATLAELTARSVCDALRRELPLVRSVVVCGGGTRNRQLMARLAALLPSVDVASSARLGVPPNQVEALAFAWLAARRIGRVPGSLSAVTGARGPRVLGALYAACAAR